ncbi:MAG: hypothetical protein M3Q03_17215 [Chloroflexota bacterium]|nr:hypothetical protein [Chloroflexota bacterium]
MTRATPDPLRRLEAPPASIRTFEAARDWVEKVECNLRVGSIRYWFDLANLQFVHETDKGRQVPVKLRSMMLVLPQERPSLLAFAAEVLAGAKAADALVGWTVLWNEFPDRPQPPPRTSFHTLADRFAGEIEAASRLPLPRTVGSDTSFGH